MNTSSPCHSDVPGWTLWLFPGLAGLLDNVCSLYDMPSIPGWRDRSAGWPGEVGFRGLILHWYCCRAANVMKSTGERVTLKVAKRAALHHGLGTLLDQPSPQVQQHVGTYSVFSVLLDHSRPVNCVSQNYDCLCLSVSLDCSQRYSCPFTWLVCITNIYCLWTFHDMSLLRTIYHSENTAEIIP